MKVVVTNDDGPDTPFLRPFVEAVKSLGYDVVVVIPERPRSAAGLARTYHKPLRVRRQGDYYLVNGYPADAVFMALKLIAPDAGLVISGVNVGENIGLEATYGSGTVGAALQAGILGVPAVAMSMEVGGDVGLMRRVVEALLRSLNGALQGVLAVSINIPRDWGGGVYCARKLARGVYNERLYDGVDPRGEKFYWRWGPRREVFEEGTDAYYFYGLRGITVLGIGESGIVSAGKLGRSLGALIGAKIISC
ncbi:putative acid phosphatase [Pyrobaculum oguniense TE7]|mgnify:CR=1 FL=1|uniref:5'-nucleotidase SurE n=1 Tax=Pyrobaculum oguniense (strain DSM 13380 / JCM 10595 / TE7) TaxID=698757 RepID=H6Q694_PYROT|nr:putative acid phosphatase [Pyrobaculum oguniense TE7]